MISRIFVAAAETEAKNPLLPADYDILWSSVVFVIMLSFFWFKVLPNFKKTLDERTEAIEGRLAAAEKAQAEAAAKTDEISKAQENNRAEASAIREEARAEGAAILAELKEQAQAEAARITSTAKAQIEAERQAALVPWQST
jgi:F-type H+-transporting ATPase subunit b